MIPEALSEIPQRHKAEADKKPHIDYKQYFIKDIGPFYKKKMQGWWFSNVSETIKYQHQ